LRFENVTFPDSVAFKCKGCGRCCREQPADVTSEEKKRIEHLGFSDFLDEADLSEPRLIRSQKDGACFFLTKTRGCAVHEVKPTICRLVPFVVVDWDYEKNLIVVDLPADCDCPGVAEGNELPFELLSRAAQEYVRDLREAVAQKEKLPSTDRLVLSKTRMLIMKLAADEET
jgi:Fe-S-cluster containining protein